LRNLNQFESMELMKVSDYCRQVGLPHYRYTRYKREFETAKVEGYLKPWVIVNDRNQQTVDRILAHKGTKPRKDRLTYDAYKEKYGFTSEQFQKVLHRLEIEEHEGQMMIVDTKLNYRLLKLWKHF
jgi:hypothetical protein